MLASSKQYTHNATAGIGLKYPCCCVLLDIRIVYALRIHVDYPCIVWQQMHRMLMSREHTQSNKDKGNAVC